MSEGDEGRVDEGRVSVPYREHIPTEITVDNLLVAGFHNEPGLDGDSDLYELGAPILGQQPARVVPLYLKLAAV